MWDDVIYNFITLENISTCTIIDKKVWCIE